MSSGVRRRCCFGSDFLGNHVSYVTWYRLREETISSKAKMHDLKTCKMRENEAQRAPPPSRMFVSKSKREGLHEQFKPLIEERTVLWITHFVASYAWSYFALCEKYVVLVIFVVCVVHFFFHLLVVEQSTVSTMSYTPFSSMKHRVFFESTPRKFWD
jgi:hypothetical protein